jgi:hypothetical protein
VGKLIRKFRYGGDRKFADKALADEDGGFISS